jgi:hypothetical protein
VRGPRSCVLGALLRVVVGLVDTDVGRRQARALSSAVGFAPVPSPDGDRDDPAR